MADSKPGFGELRNYPYTIKRGPVWARRIVYHAGHPSSAIRNDAGEYTGSYWCDACNSAAHYGVYRVGVAWVCPTCKSSCSPKQKQPSQFRPEHKAEEGMLF